MTKAELIEKAMGLGLGTEEDLDRLKVNAIQQLVDRFEESQKPAVEGPKVVTVDDLMKLGRIKVSEA